MFKIGAGFEKLSFFVIVLSLLCHCVACLWIFQTSIQEENPDPDSWDSNMNWITKNGFEDLTRSELYIVAFYWTVTTISTVGYGDISGTNSFERLLASSLMICGVFFFSFASGSMT